MQNYPVLGAASCALIGLAILGDYGVPKLPVASPRLVPVNSFPLQIDQWQAGPALPVDPDVQKKLYTATISDRDYTDEYGQSVDVTLVTATDSDHIHDPMLCFPAQGWQLTNLRRVQLDGKSVSTMDASLGDQHEKVVYWTTAYYAPPTPQNELVRRIAALRYKEVGRHEGTSLFVRLMAQNDDNGHNATVGFALQAMPYIDAMVDSIMTPDERRRVALHESPDPSTVTN